MSREKVQLVNELHKPIRINFPRRKTIIKGLDDLWQADLAQMDRYAKENRGFKFILLVIDCFSKYVWAKPIKSKSSDDVTEAFSAILKESKRNPQNLNTDQGMEFYNSNFQSLMKKYNINHYSTFSHKKAAIVERAIRTIKEKLYKYFSLNGSYRWIETLPEIIKTYNGEKHSVTKMKPRTVSKKHEKTLLNTVYNYSRLPRKKPKFKIDDVVRISKAKHVFEKGYTPNWTTELFKIQEIKTSNPTTYLLKDMSERPIRGAFYQQELQKTENPDVYLVEKILRRKGKKVYVKWLGLDKSHNSWLDANNKL